MKENNKLSVVSVLLFLRSCWLPPIGPCWRRPLKWPRILGNTAPLPSCQWQWGSHLEQPLYILLTWRCPYW